MFADEALDTVSVQSLWRKSHEAAQESVSLGNTESAPHRTLLAWTATCLLSTVAEYWLDPKLTLADATHACSGVPGWTHLHSEENALQDDIMKYAASSKQGHFMQTAPT